MRLFSIAVASLLLLGCANNPQVEDASSHKEKLPTEKKEPEVQDTAFYLNNDNAVEFLSNYFKENTERQVVISTKFGDIEITLSDRTPVHTGNFLYLVKEWSYYDSTLFYRVAENFIIQGGDADSYLISGRKYAIGDYALPQEIHPSLYHKVGAVAMCKNYTKRNYGLSSSYDFYIVIGDKSKEIQLQAHERELGISYSPERREYYKQVGGTPHLDEQHTVFGQVTNGMDVVRKISELPTDSQDWPDSDVFMNIKIKP